MSANGSLSNGAAKAELDAAKRAVAPGAPESDPKRVKTEAGTGVG